MSEKILDNPVQWHVNMCRDNRSYNLTRDELIGSKSSINGSLSPLKSSGLRGVGIINFRNKKSIAMKANLGLPDFNYSKQEAHKYA